MGRINNQRRRSLKRRAAATAAAGICITVCTSCGIISGGEILTTANAFAVGGGPIHVPSMGRLAPSPGTEPSSSSVLGSVFQSPSAPTGTSSALHMASSSNALRTTKSPHIPTPPTPDEEVDLLTLAVEYGRLRDLERDMALRKSPTLSPSPLLSERAAAAGYGADIHAYERALEDGQKARDALVTRNMGLVYHVVSNVVGNPDTAKKRGGINKNNKSNKNKNKYKLNSLTREDLIQEGAIGLARAVDKYDPTGTNGARFATYAVYWIRAAVLRCIAERDDLVRVPEYVSASVKRLTAAASRLGVDLDDAEVIDAHVGLLVNKKAAGATGKALTSEVAWRQAERARLLAEEAGLTDKQLAEAVKVRRRRMGGGYTALEPWMQSKMTAKSVRANQDAVVADGGTVTSSTTSVAVTPSGDTMDDKNEIRRVLSRHLQPKEMEALSWRYGLNQARVIAATTTAAAATPKPRPKDYEEEALEDLFGKGGILASYSAEPQPSTVKAIISSRSKAASTEKFAAAPPAASRTPQPTKGGRWGEAMSFAEVGRNMAVSAEYGRRLCSQALKKLQVAADEGRLELQPDWLGV